MAEHKLEMQQLSQIYHEETEKNHREIMDSNDERMKHFTQDPQEKFIDYLGEAGFPETHEDFDYIENRIYHDYIGTIEHNMRDPNHAAGEGPNKTYTPYEQDMSHYPEVFKKHFQENYADYDDVKKRFDDEDEMEEAGPDMFERQTPADMTPWDKKYNDVLPRYTGTLCQ